MKIISLCLVLFISLVLPKPALATVGNNCCAGFQYSYLKDQGKCISSLTPSQWKDLCSFSSVPAFLMSFTPASVITIPSCGIGAILDFFKKGGLPIVPGLPSTCDADKNEICDIKTQTCQSSTEANVDNFTIPTCDPKTQVEILGQCCTTDVSLKLGAYLTPMVGATGNGTVDLIIKVVSTPGLAQELQKSCSPKTYCSGPDSKVLKYNATKKVCEQKYATLWAFIENCDGQVGVKTAIGCVPTGSLTDFLGFLLKYVFFAAGGIIVLMMIATGYTVVTSQGNPEKLQAARENIIALFSGLILIAFSLILLQAIGADILGLSAFK